MVDPIGIKPVNPAARPQPVQPSEPVRAVQAATSNAAPIVESGLRSLAAEAGKAPPVDLERVAKIRAAIRDGNFPLVPTTVADRLLALRLNWKPNEPS